MHNVLTALPRRSPALVERHLCPAPGGDGLKNPNADLLGALNEAAWTAAGVLGRRSGAVAATAAGLWALTGLTVHPTILAAMDASPTPPSSGPKAPLRRRRPLPWSPGGRPARRSSLSRCTHPPRRTRRGRSNASASPARWAAAPPCASAWQSSMLGGAEKGSATRPPGLVAQRRAAPSPPCECW